MLVSLSAVTVGRRGLSQKFSGNLVKEKVNQCPNSVPLHFLCSLANVESRIYPTTTHWEQVGLGWAGG